MLVNTEQVKEAFPLEAPLPKSHLLCSGTFILLLYMHAFYIYLETPGFSRALLHFKAFGWQQQSVLHYKPEHS